MRTLLRRREWSGGKRGGARNGKSTAVGTHLRGQCASEEASGRAEHFEIPKVDNAGGRVIVRIRKKNMAPGAASTPTGIRLINCGSPFKSSRLGGGRIHRPMIQI